MLSFGVRPGFSSLLKASYYHVTVTLIMSLTFKYPWAEFYLCYQICQVFRLITKVAGNKIWMASCFLYFKLWQNTSVNQYCRHTFVIKLKSVIMDYLSTVSTEHRYCTQEKALQEGIICQWLIHQKRSLHPVVIYFSNVSQVFWSSILVKTGQVFKEQFISNLPKKDRLLEAPFLSNGHLLGEL